MTHSHNSQSLIASVGMFDGVHLGHRYLFDCLRAEAHGSRPLALTFANHPMSIIAPDRAPALLTTPAEKQQLISSLGVDVAMLRFDAKLRSLTAREFLDLLRSEYGVGRLLLGFNNRFGSDRGNSFADYQRIGAEAGIAVEAARPFTLPDGSAVSSTAIRQAIAEGNVSHAAAMLGRPYRLSGIVEHGRQLGRSIGFPTANIPLTDSEKAIPAVGVYAADATTADGHSYRAIVNIGSRPTVEVGGAVNLEAHIDGFAGDLYGSNVDIDFIARLRGEQRFDSLDALTRQLHADLAAARSL